MAWEASALQVHCAGTVQCAVQYSTVTGVLTVVHLIDLVGTLKGVLTVVHLIDLVGTLDDAFSGPKKKLKGAIKRASNALVFHIWLLWMALYTMHCLYNSPGWMRYWSTICMAHAPCNAPLAGETDCAHARVEFHASRAV